MIRYLLRNVALPYMIGFWGLEAIVVLRQQRVRRECRMDIIMGEPK
jgi:hypothetical protein